MPAGKPTAGKKNEDNPAQRTTFRPPWVKDSSDTSSGSPWPLKSVSRRDSNSERSGSESPGRRSSLTKTNENGTTKENTFVKPQLRPVPPKDPSKMAPKENKLPPVKLNSVADRKPPLTRVPTKDEEKPKIPRQDSLRKVSLTPAPPPMPPPAPALPNIELKPLSKTQKEKIEQLKSRPKTRPDWTAMLKEIESNKKLKHVECNDRSKPLLPKQKAKGQFLYDSEQQNAHNELLKQIQQGIHLKSVKTNDRSKPLLEGLRKFRRQMTIEEQIQKSVSMASIPPEEIIADEVDEMDDIDKVRDDLQSTKQMLAIELRNKEAQIRENKRLLARIQNLEVELEKEKSHTRNHGHGHGPNEVDEKLIIALKIEAAEARKATVELEKKLRETADELDDTKTELENVKKQNQILEKKLQDAAQGKRVSISEKKEGGGGAGDDKDESNEEADDSESSSDGEDTEEKRERRLQRELKMLRNKLRNFKNKEDNAKKERAALKEIMRKNQAAMKEEKKRYKSLQKEVDKMASLMKDVSSEDEEAEEEEDDDEDAKEEEEETSSESSDSESETSDSDSEKSQSEPEDAPIERKKENLTRRTKRHENILAALKKGNFMLKTNCERLQDDLNKQKEMTMGLQEDLDSVLAELG